MLRFAISPSTDQPVRARLAQLAEPAARLEPPTGLSLQPDASSPTDPLIGEWLLAPDQVQIESDDPPPERVSEQLEPARPAGAWWSRARVSPGRRGVVVLVIVGLAVALIVGFFAWRSRPVSESFPVAYEHSRAGLSPSDSAATSANSSARPTEIVAAVSGSVRQPGLVHLKPGARVNDAIAAAGGLNPGASTGDLNVARRVVDGELIVVGKASGAAPGDSSETGEVPNHGVAADAAAPSPGGPLVDLNTATVGQLDALPGIGPTLAQHIVDYRSAHARFNSVNDLHNVDGIGETRFARLKPLVTV